MAFSPVDMKRIAIMVLPVFGLISCGSDPTAASSSTSARRLTLEESCNEKSGFVQDAKGNWVPQVDRRSSFESKGASPYFNGEYGTRQYSATTLKSTPWWGAKDYTTKAFPGKTVASQFQKTASADGTHSQEEGKISSTDGKAMQTGNVKTGAAREAQSGDMNHTASLPAESPNRTFVPADAVDWQQQRAMSLEETKNILGR